VATETKVSTEQLLSTMKDVVTARIWEALNGPKPPKASTLNAAIQWLRITGNVEDPDGRYRPRPMDPALIQSMPFVTPEERAKLAASVQHAVESMEGEDDPDSDF
jgi:hypothetical protein